MLCTVFCGRPSRSEKPRTAGWARSNGSPGWSAAAADAAAANNAAASAAAARVQVVGITLMQELSGKRCKATGPPHGGQFRLEEVESAEMVVDAVARLAGPTRIASLHPRP